MLALIKCSQLVRSAMTFQANTPVASICLMNPYSPPLFFSSPFCHSHDSHSGRMARPVAVLSLRLKSDGISSSSDTMKKSCSSLSLMA